MTIRIAQFVHAASDVVDEAFLRDFPEVEAAKAHSLESLAKALDGAEILHVYNSAFTAEFARLVRDKGRALRWIQFTTVGIEIGLRAGLRRASGSPIAATSASAHLQPTPWLCCWA